MEGLPLRRLYDLPLRRSQHPIFAFGWTLLHVIDESSPLRGESEQSLMMSRANLLLSVAGTDESTGQTLMARKHYSSAAIRWNHTFADILTVDPDGTDRFDYTKFHQSEPVAIEDPESG